QSKRSTATIRGPTATASPELPSTYRRGRRILVTGSAQVTAVSVIDRVADGTPSASCWVCTSFQTAIWSDVCPEPAWSERVTDDRRTWRIRAEATAPVPIPGRAATPHRPFSTQETGTRIAA